MTRDTTGKGCLSGDGLFYTVGLCLNRRNGQGVHYLFQAPCRHLDRKEEDPIPEDDVPDLVQDLIFFATIINSSDQGHENKTHSLLPIFIRCVLMPR